MTDPLAEAAQDAIAAADNAELVRTIAAVLAAQQATPQPAAPPAPARPEFDARKWLVIGGVVVSVGLVGALFAVAIAVGATCATACLLILRGLWADFQKKH